jgi:hypothetical protein
MVVRIVAGVAASRPRAPNSARVVAAVGGMALQGGDGCTGLTATGMALPPA